MILLWPLGTAAIWTLGAVEVYRTRHAPGAIEAAVLFATFGALWPLVAAGGLVGYGILKAGERWVES